MTFCFPPARQVCQVARREKEAVGSSWTCKWSGKSLEEGWILKDKNFFCPAILKNDLIRHVMRSGLRRFSLLTRSGTQILDLINPSVCARYWGKMLQSHCDGMVRVTDVIPITNALVETLPEEAFSMVTRTFLFVG